MNLDILQRIGGPAVQKSLLKLSKYAPEILTGVGIAGVIGGTILIARASTKVAPVMEFNQLRVTDVKERKDEIENYGRELALARAKNGLDIAKLYGPGVTLEVAALISILAAHGIMRRRAVVLLGAYKAVEASFNAYRQKVIEAYGEDVDRDFRLGFKTETIVDPETNKKTKLRTIDPNHISRYAKWFDEGNSNYRRDLPDYNLAFIKNAQNWSNDKLRLRGFLFLHEVYDLLGFDTTPEAQIVGWVMDPENGGDLHVDFNLYRADNRDFINGQEPAVLLDFNVDGVILDMI